MKLSINQKMLFKKINRDEFWYVHYGVIREGLFHAYILKTIYKLDYCNKISKSYFYAIFIA